MPAPTDCLAALVGVVPADGATPGYRLRYVVGVPLRFDRYFARIRLWDGYAFGARDDIADFSIVPYDSEAGCGGSGDGSDDGSGYGFYDATSDPDDTRDDLDPTHVTDLTDARADDRAAETVTLTGGHL